MAGPVTGQPMLGDRGIQFGLVGFGLAGVEAGPLEVVLDVFLPPCYRSVEVRVEGFPGVLL